MLYSTDRSFFLLETMMSMSFGNKLRNTAVSILAGSVLGMAAYPAWLEKVGG